MRIIKISQIAQHSRSGNQFYAPLFKFLEQPRQRDRLCDQKVVRQAAEIVRRAKQADKHNFGVQHREIHHQVIRFARIAKSIFAYCERNDQRHRADKQAKNIDAFSREIRDLKFLAHHGRDVDHDAE